MRAAIASPPIRFFLLLSLAACSSNGSARPADSANGRSGSFVLTEEQRAKIHLVTVQNTPFFTIAFGQVLVGGSSVPLAVRIGERSLLARRDIPEGMLPLRTLAEEVLVTEGLSLLDEDTPLGIPAGIQLAGLRVATWDLWGVDIDQAYVYLRQAVVGSDPTFATDAGPGVR